MSKVSPDLARLYEKPGKRQFTQLCMRLAGAQQCRTVGLFWGGGGDSRLFAASGFDVLAVDNDESLAEPMKVDGERHGYATFAGNARRVDEARDFWHADFMNTPNPNNFQTLRHIAGQTRKWLAVTVATDHIKNPEMQGESLMATLPSWMTFAAEGFTLEYFGFYRRNAAGLRMWTGILQRRRGKGVMHSVLPVQIARSVQERGYWASRPMFGTGLLPHSWSLTSDKTRASQRIYYQNHKDDRRAASRAWRSRNLDQRRERERAWREANPDKRRAAQRRWYEAHRDDPVRKARQQSRSRSWYEANHQGKGPTERECPECETTFSSVQFRLVCSDECARRRDRRQENARRRAKRRLAAVSGTATEAIKAA